MTYSDNESDLSEALTTLIILFSLAIRSTVFSKPPTKAIRNIESRRSIILKVLKAKRPTSPVPRASNNYILLVPISSGLTESPYNE